MLFCNFAQYFANIRRETYTIDAASGQWSNIPNAKENPMAKIVRSPRAPSFSLEESLRNALTLYEGNGKHLIPAEVAAKALGYSGANNGSAARALASMKSFGLLESNNKGDLAVSGDVEGYKYAPDDEHKQELLVRWLRLPKIYAELLDEYHDRLPSDQAIRYKLIKMGFLPSAAEECLKNLKASVQFSRYYDRPSEPDDLSNESGMMGEASPPEAPSSPASPANSSSPAAPTQSATPTHSADRIPVRLSRGRRAWIEIPSPLYKADKDLLKAQIDLIFTDEEPDPFE